MRIDFYHVDLLKDVSKLKEISTIDVECNTTTNYNLMAKSDDSKKDNLRFTQDYLEIKNMFDLDETLADNEQTFLSDDDLSKLKKSILNNEYNINIKALSMSLIKYLERC